VCSSDLWTGLDTRTVTSGKSTFLPKAAGRYAFSFATGAVTRSGGTGTSAAWTSYFVYSKFEATKSYTIAVKLYKKTSYKFAGSNIYWNGSELTFFPHGENDYTKYLGVLFKWGSLIGVSPARTDGNVKFHRRLPQGLRLLGQVREDGVSKADYHSRRLSPLAGGGFFPF
jgi:hypothetical protein